MDMTLARAALDTMETALAGLSEYASTLMALKQPVDAKELRIIRDGLNGVIGALRVPPLRDVRPHVGTIVDAMIDRAIIKSVSGNSLDINGVNHLAVEAGETPIGKRVLYVHADGVTILRVTGYEHLTTIGLHKMHKSPVEPESEDAHERFEEGTGPFPTRP